eukprot:1326769-Alexandrium_andersonii.AAC.1
MGPRPSRRPFRLGAENTPFTPWPSVDLSITPEWYGIVVPLQGDDIGRATAHQWVMRVCELLRAPPRDLFAQMLLPSVSHARAVVVLCPQR